MSEGIWVYVYFIFCGFWFAVILIGIGVMIGGMYSRCIKDVLHGNIDSRDCSSCGNGSRNGDNGGNI